MRWRSAFIALVMGSMIVVPGTAFAGDGATIVFNSGSVIYINNGFNQLAGSLKEFNRSGSENYNYIVEINIEGSTFFVNLGDVSVICRDSCSAMNILASKK